MPHHPTNSVIVAVPFYTALDFLTSIVLPRNMAPQFLSGDSAAIEEFLSRFDVRRSLAPLGLG